MSLCLGTFSWASTSKLSVAVAEGTVDAPSPSVTVDVTALGRDELLSELRADVVLSVLVTAEVIVVSDATSVS